MSATSFKAAELGPGPAVAADASPFFLHRLGQVARERPRLVGHLVDGALAAVVIVAWVVMARNPEWATIPYHLMFLSVALVYGYRVWPVPAAAVVILVITLSTGALMVLSYARNEIDAAELSEIPLMPALLLAMVWHARRRAAAMRALMQMADRQQSMIERERAFFRDTSHAIRTPVTIARGHLELVTSLIAQPVVRGDVEVALRQLDRMAVLSNRLLALAQLDAGETLPAEQMDLADFVHEVGTDWSAKSRRRWVVECPSSAPITADPVWLALAIDAMVENAVHFTADNGTISITGVVRYDTCAIVVEDDGEGIAPEDLEHVFDRFWHRLPPSGPMGSGLGLAMARATARAWGGDVIASGEPRRGARLEFSLPRRNV